tara:strand:- start:44000 stop:44647 length:648 start_codon:yes stop_codon:yes gene_type:complete
MNRKKVIILDYGLGNLLSVKRAIEMCDAEVSICNDANKIKNADHLVLPGVGNFSVAMIELKSRGFIDALLSYAKLERPLLGICLGMQILFDSSEEQGLHSGLGIIQGEVKQIPKQNQKSIDHKIPHIGWSPLTKITTEKNNNISLLENNDLGKYYYFVHSYQGHTKNPSHTLASISYNELEITAAVQKGYIIGCQFHPEKSGTNGLELIKRFISI